MFLNRIFQSSIFAFSGLYPYGASAGDGILGQSLFETQTITFQDDGFPFGENELDAVNVSH